jgi:hypothetical protein
VVCPVEAAGRVVLLGADVERVARASRQQTHLNALRAADNFLVDIQKSLVGNLRVRINEDDLSFDLTILED